MKAVHLSLESALVRVWTRKCDIEPDHYFPVLKLLVLIGQ